MIRHTGFTTGVVALSALLVVGPAFVLPGAASSGEGCAAVTVNGIQLNGASSTKCAFTFDVVPGAGEYVWMRPMIAPPLADGSWTMDVVPMSPARNPAHWPTDNGGIINTNEAQKVPVNSAYGTWLIEGRFNPNSILWQSGLWGVYACQGPDNAGQCLQDGLYAVCLVVRDRLAPLHQIDCHEYLG